MNKTDVNSLCRVKEDDEEMSAEGIEEEDSAAEDGRIVFQTERIHQRGKKKAEIQEEDEEESQEDTEEIQSFNLRRRKKAKMQEKDGVDESEETTGDFQVSERLLQSGRKTNDRLCHSESMNEGKGKSGFEEYIPGGSSSKKDKSAQGKVLKGERSSVSGDLSGFSSSSEDSNSDKSSLEAFDACGSSSGDFNACTIASEDVSACGTASEDVNVHKLSSGDVNDRKSSSGDVIDLKPLSGGLSDCEASSEDVNSGKTTSGDVNCCQTSSGDVNDCKSSSGDLNDRKTLSGDVNSCKISSEDINDCKSSSGDLNDCKTSSGNDKSREPSLGDSNDRKSSSGDVKGRKSSSGESMVNIKREIDPKTKEETFKCQICGKIFVQLCKLRQHMDYHADEKPYPCSICGLRFKWHSSRYAHEMRHSKETAVSDDVSGTSKSDRNASDKSPNVNASMEGERVVKDVVKGMFPKRRIKCEDDDDGDKPYPCRECGMRYKWRSSRHWHELRHSGVMYKKSRKKMAKKKVEVVSNSSDDDIKEVDVNESGVKPLDRKPYPCRVCGLRFKWPTDRNAHESQHPKQSTGSRNAGVQVYTKKVASERDKSVTETSVKGEIKNESVGGNTKSRDDVIKEAKLKEKGPKPFSSGANFSDESTTSDSDLDEIEAHGSGNLSQETFVCVICEVGFETKDCLRMHRCTQQFFLDCKSCGKKFSQKHLLDSHASVCTGNSAFGCKICRIVCKSSIGLKNHMASHSMERNFPCSICGVRLKTDTYRKMHEKRHLEWEKII